jgi:hypothetical protein
MDGIDGTGEIGDDRALAAFRFISSAPSTMTMRHPPSAAVRRP